MNGPRLLRSILRGVAVLMLVGIWQSPLSVQSANQPPGLPVSPPLPPSPIQQFREWLSLKGDERQKAVAAWPTEKQKVLLEKLRAYEALPSEERERRLQVLELRWYLRPMMALKSEDRTGALAVVPPVLRRVVQERLHRWDSLDPRYRKEILENDNAREWVTRYLLQVQQGRSREQILQELNPQRRAELEKALKDWNSVSTSARSRTASQLTGFFQLSREAQARPFQTLPETERQDIQRTLDSFAKLSPEQRKVCVESFEKFTLMPPPERASFLRNAARWEAMTPQDRAAWKELVTKLPPLPPAPVMEPPRPNASAVNGKGMALTNGRE